MMSYDFDEGHLMFCEKAENFIIVLRHLKHFIMNRGVFKNRLKSITFTEIRKRKKTNRNFKEKLEKVLGHNTEVLDIKSIQKFSMSSIASFSIRK